MPTERRGKARGGNKPKADGNKDVVVSKASSNGVADKKRKTPENSEKKNKKDEEMDVQGDDENTFEMISDEEDDIQRDDDEERDGLASGFTFDDGGLTAGGWDFAHAKRGSRGTKSAITEILRKKRAEIELSDDEEEKNEEDDEEEEEEDKKEDKKAKNKGSDSENSDDDSDSDDDDSSSSSSEDEEDEETAKKKAREAEYFDDTPVSAPTTISFAGLHLSKSLTKAVSTLGFRAPTRIQAMAIPALLEGKDVCASARTGSGKTAMFMLPILERLLYKSRVAAIKALVLAPTRELAAQCHSMSENLAQYTQVRIALVIGGTKTTEQEVALRSKPDIVIATPGRIIDLLRNSVGIHVDDLEILVLDEADRLLELGFKDELMEIVKMCPVQRQTILTSATMTHEVDDLITLSLKRPLRISDDASVRTSEFSVNKVAVPKTLTQEFVRIRESHEQHRAAVLLSLLTRSFKSRILVFFREKRTCHRMRVALALLGLSVTELHGNLTQEQRLEAVENFRDKKYEILVATDIAARGIDISGINTVINYETPRSVSEYIHRVGRTARAGKTGVSVTLADDSIKTKNLLKEIMKSAPDCVKKRTVPPASITECAKKLEKISDKIEEVIEEERIERQLRIAEMEEGKATNMIKHHDEIMARAPRTWFQTEKQKKLAKGFGKPVDEQQNGNEENAAPLRAKVFEKASEAKYAGMSRLKRRRLQLDGETKVQKGGKPSALRGIKGVKHVLNEKKKGTGPTKTIKKTVKKSRDEFKTVKLKKGGKPGNKTFKSKAKHKRR